MGVRRLTSSPHFAPLALLAALAFVFWSRVLITGNVLLPGEMLTGFLPFGGKATAPWTILQWDSLAQYYPWRLHAARSIQSGVWPLWNPYQFTGTPLLANLQSAVFYPLNLPFWIMDPARAFGVSAFFHTLLAAFSTYFLAQRWKLSRAASVLAAVAFAFCGYLSSWALLPTLAATASWLPLCVLLLEKTAQDNRWLGWFLGLAAALSCALLAGHAQIFFYVLLVLTIRVLFLGRAWLKGLICLEVAFVLALLLGSVQLLPTLELARRGHRAGESANLAAWGEVRKRALKFDDLPGLALPGTQSSMGTLNENFGYVGLGALLLAVAGVVAILTMVRKREGANTTGPTFALALAIAGLLYALATPFAAFFFFGVPGIAQMGGTGRSLLIWSLGIALLAGLGLDFARRHLKSSVLPIVAMLWVGAELFGYGFISQPTAPREMIYPQTKLMTWLQGKSSPKARVLFVTPKKGWLPTELLQGFGRSHPPGVLPPNGATVYGIHDVNGYDSLSPAGYRKFVSGEEEGGASPPLNGNMVLLNNLGSRVLLDTLLVKYVVVPIGEEVPDATQVLLADGCAVWERTLPETGSRIDGAAFYPGWKNGQYEPQSFRVGTFLSLVGLLFLSVGAGFVRGKRLRDVR